MQRAPRGVGEGLWGTVSEKSLSILGCSLGEGGERGRHALPDSWDRRDRGTTRTGGMADRGPVGIGAVAEPQGPLRRSRRIRGDDVPPGFAAEES